MHFRRFKALALALVCLTLKLPLSSVAEAQSVTLSGFLPGETAADDFQLSRPVDQGHLRFGAQLHLDYANSPLVVEISERGDSTEIAEVVGHQLNGTLGLSLGLADRLVVYVGLPVVLWMVGADATRLSSFGVPAHDQAGLGNLYAGARGLLFGGAEELAALAIQATVHVPTAGDQAYRGSDRVAVHPELLFELHPSERLRITANLGSVIRKRGGVQLLSERNELTYGLGAGFVVYRGQADTTTHLDLLAQIYGRAQYADLFGRSDLADGTALPLELLVGAKYFHRSGLSLGAAAGPGITRGAGSPDARVVGMLAYAMPEPVPDGDADGDGLLDSEDRCPQTKEDKDDFEDEDGCPDADNDRDGIPDDADSCPLAAEDRDEFADEDGCPDPDNDQDGVRDAVDRCPLVAEDRDEFEDMDGCPDEDNDGDGLADGTDRCPNEAGVAANSGCPDPDRDGDTVVDRLDNCPDEPGDVRNHGCKKKQQVRLEGDRLVILDVVYFATNSDRIESRSFPLLMNVASVLTAHPEIKRLRVEGHTDSRGRHERNMTLSKDRAAAVKVFLTTRGEIEDSRLETEGFGPDQPIVPNASSADEHARNRRVEFKILQ